MNFVIITAVLSVANSGLYANSRMLWAMAKQGMASPAFTKLTKKGVPLNALIFSLIFASLSLLTSVFAADTVFLVLTSIAKNGQPLSFGCQSPLHSFSSVEIS